MSNSYFVHGLALSSEIELHEPIVQHERASDVRITIGEPRIESLASDERILLLERADRVLYEAAEREGQWIVRAPGLASFEVSDRSIAIHGETEVEDRDVLSLLLAGTGLSFYLMAQGELCLHASAVEADGRCVAFAGSSGRGKTTMAAMACSAGYPLFGDDLLRVDAAAEVAYRGSSELRLRQAVTYLADQIEGACRVTIDSRTSVRPVCSQAEVLPLAVIVLPRPDRQSTNVEVRRLRGSAAFSGLAECPRLLGWRTARYLNSEFEHLVKLSSSVPVVEAVVPWQAVLDPANAGEVIRQSLAAAAE